MAITGFLLAVFNCEYYFWIRQHQLIFYWYFTDLLPMQDNVFGPCPCALCTFVHILHVVNFYTTDHNKIIRAIFQNKLTIYKANLPSFIQKIIKSRCYVDLSRRLQLKSHPKMAAWERLILTGTDCGYFNVCRLRLPRSDKIFEFLKKNWVS